MELPSIKQLKSDAAHALRRGREPKTVILWYAGIVTLVAVAISLLNLSLSSQIRSTGGLGNLGTRTILSTVQTILPMVNTLAMACLELGYLHAMLRICRGQYADQTDLKMGFSKFFPLVRLMAMLMLLGILIGWFTYQAAFTIFLITPWANPLMELAGTLSQGSILDSSMIITEELAAQALPAMLPMLLIWMLLLAAVLIPFSYRTRFASLALLDEPKGSAFRALMTSFKMTRKQCWKLFKLDLSFWWYYGLVALATVLGSLDMLLDALGVLLPMNGDFTYYLFYGLYLAANFAICYFLLNRVQSTYVMAYESLREKPVSGGVVLGNIFDV